MKLAAAVVALLGVFAAISIGVVRERDPLDREVQESFDTRLSRLGSHRIAVEPLPCHKASLNFFDCAAWVGIRRRGSTTVGYRLWLRDDGCWSTTSESPLALPPALQRPSGCITG